MLLREIIAPPQAAPAAAPAGVEPEPTQKDIADIQALIGTIDPAKEKPEGLLTKLTGWMKSNPIIDKVTDIIPQTRLIKAINSAIDSIEAGDNKGALNALAGAVGGNLATLAKGVNVGTALAQGDVKSAALAAGGNVATAAKGISAANSLAQGDVGGAVGNISKTAGTAVTALQNKLAPTETADYKPDELKRIRELAAPRV